MAIKLIALDLDGTLTNDEKKITQHSKDVIKMAADKGVAIALASGRPVLGIAPVAEELGLNDYESYIMAFNGGQIFDWRTKETISKVIFNRDYIPDALAFSRKYNMPLLTYSDTEILSEGPLDCWSHHEEENCGRAIHVVDNLMEYLDFPIVKMLLCGDPEALCPPEKEISEYFKGKLDIYRAADYFMELMPKGINKAAGLKALGDHMGITKDEIMACGDAHNDLTMVEYSGMGVAVANAVDEVKAAAKFVSLSNNDDGVAYAIEKFVLDA